MTRNQVLKNIINASKEITQHHVIAERAIIQLLIEAVPTHSLKELSDKVNRNHPAVMTPAFASWVKEALEKLKVSQLSLSKKIKFSQGDISKIINNDKSAGYTKRTNFAAKLLKYLASEGIRHEYSSK